MEPVPPRRRGRTLRPSRRQVLTGALAGAGLLGAGFATSTTTGLFRAAQRIDPVRSVTVAFTSAKGRSSIGDDGWEQLPPNSRVMPDIGDPGPLLRQQKFLAVCRPWLDSLPAHRRDLAASALLDLWVLTDSLPATVASWAQPWRYIWPRDAAFAAVALARVGAVDVAWQHLLHFQSLQSEDGTFAARFTPDLGQVPDDRASQADSVGLLLWAVSEVQSAAARHSPQAGPHPTEETGNVDEALSAMKPMLRRSSTLLLRLTENGRALPPVSPDYWEVGESQITLGIAGPTLIGLQAMATLAEGGDGLWDHIDGGPASVIESSLAFDATFARTFIANGLQRYPTSGGLDSAIAYLPAAGAGLGLEASTLDHVWERLQQPAGGIKPGHGWIFDRSSWTPSTSLMGLGYARLGATAQADGILDWLSEHRTAAGSLPEKVTEDGVGVSVAPLSWTASNVVLCLDELANPHG